VQAAHIYVGPLKGDLPVSDYADVLTEASDLISTREYQRALALLIPLVEVPVPGALSLLGVMYQLGEGVERNGTKAVELLTKAVKLGDGSAAHNLGTIYGMGMPGIPQNHQLSRQFYRKAKAMGAQFANNEFYD